MSAPFLSYSANSEDVILNRLFGAQADGFFVDVGAAHPLFENDTRALYDRGWHGINIEPTAAFHRELAAGRPRDLNLHVAVSDEPGELVLHEVIGTGLSTGDAEDAARAAAKGFEVVRHSVPARTLRDILEQAGAPAIDLLKVDVEGFELRVLRSNDWDRFRPRIILAEATFPESPLRRPNGVAGYLAGQGYRPVYFDGLNDFYAERDFVVPPEACDRPPNVFDRFVPFAQHELERAKAALTAEVTGLRQERENAASYIASLTTELERRNAAYSALDAAHAALSDQLRRTTLTAEAVSIDLHRAYAELIAMRVRGEALAAEPDAADMRRMLAEREAQAHRAESERMARQLAAMHASSSWRITRPLRALARPQHTWGMVVARLTR